MIVLSAGPRSWGLGWRASACRVAGIYLALSSLLRLLLQARFGDALIGLAAACYQAAYELFTQQCHR